MQSYPTTLSISYSNDLEYRSCIRKLFSMKHVVSVDPEIDDVTRDEQDYDIDAASEKLDYIFDQTQEHPRFQELYDIAASKMISLDRSIGLSVLFSYDYMAAFHECLCSFFENPSGFNESNVTYLALKRKLG
jgi:hypothetical protein